MHDAGPKVILGQPFPAVRFVSDHPSPQLVGRLAAVYLRSGGDIRRVVRAIAESPDFWSAAARGAKIKSPFELAASPA